MSVPEACAYFPFHPCGSLLYLTPSEFSFCALWQACKGNMKRMLRLQVRLDAKEITSMVHDELRVLLPLFQ